MKGKTVRETMVTMAERVMPQDTNPAGFIHGGVILKLIDSAASVVATRHARSNVVTASIDRMSFLEPIHVGELVMFKASLNYVGRSSMEVGVRVEAENLTTGVVRHAATAYLTFVSLDGRGHPAPVPELVLETDVEKRRNEEAEMRREMRLKERERELAMTNARQAVRQASESKAGQEQVKPKEK